MNICCDCKWPANQCRCGASSRDESELPYSNDLPYPLRRIEAAINFCQHIPTELLEALAKEGIGAATFMQWAKDGGTFPVTDHGELYGEACIHCSEIVDAPAGHHDESCLLDKALKIMGDKP